MEIAMSTTERQYLLSTDDHIKLKEINLKDSEKRAKSSTEFSILSVVGKGGSSVCYEAYCESNGTTGRLKEFYPIIPLNPRENLYSFIIFYSFLLTCLVRSPPLQILFYKIKWWDELLLFKHFVKIDKMFPSSKLCSHCGYKKQDLTLFL